MRGSRVAYQAFLLQRGQEPVEDHVVDGHRCDAADRAEPHQPAQRDLELLGQRVGQLLPGWGEGGQIAAGQQVDAGEAQGLAEQAAHIGPPCRSQAVRRRHDPGEAWPQEARMGRDRLGRQGSTRATVRTAERRSARPGCRAGSRPSRRARTTARVGASAAAKGLRGKAGEWTVADMDALVRTGDDHSDISLLHLSTNQRG